MTSTDEAAQGKKLLSVIDFPLRIYTSHTGGDG